MRKFLIALLSAVSLMAPLFGGSAACAGSDTGTHGTAGGGGNIPRVQNPPPPIGDVNLKSTDSHFQAPGEVPLQAPSIPPPKAKGRFGAGLSPSSAPVNPSARSSD